MIDLHRLQQDIHDNPQRLIDPILNYNGVLLVQLHWHLV
jgi:hypothetical protein